MYQHRILVGLAVTLAWGCSNERSKLDQAAPAPVASTVPATAAAMPARPAPPPSGEGALSGTVVETMNAGGYTYAKVDRAGHDQIWVAGPETALAVGTTLGTMKGSLMPNFHSDTLNRTFDQIYFVDSLPVSGGAGPNPHGARPPAPAAPIEKIERAEGGKTVAEIFAGKDALVGKAVVVRAKVVKVNNNILGHNWLHVQDGTGDAGTSDLIVTTAATVTPGTTVVLRGKVTTNKDLGAGYRYAVLLEDATVADK
jgi:hypothetical protein